jgi:hypothetical protein
MVTYDQWLYMTDPVSPFRHARLHLLNYISILNQSDVVKTRNTPIPA